MNTAAKEGHRPPDDKPPVAEPLDGDLAHYPIRQAVERALARYLKDLDGTDPVDLYQVVLTEVEKPLLGVVLKHARGNRGRAARMLGINRNTLRKKLRLYSLSR